MRIKDIAIIGMMGAVLVASKATLAFLPNIELVSLLIILCTLNYGWKTIYIIYVFVLTEGLLYGLFTDWWYLYLYAWPILYLIAMLFKKNRSAYFWALISGAFGLSFGALYALLYLFIGGVPTALAKWTSGIPFDITHGIGNFLLVIVLFRPLNHTMGLITKEKETM